MKRFLKLIFDFFSSSKSSEPKEAPQATTPTEPVKPIGSIKKVGIIIGHGPNGKDPGALSWDEKRNEFEYNSKVANFIKDNTTHGKEIKLFWRGKTGVVGVGYEAVSWNPDLSIELHLNSFNKLAHGCEVLCLKGDAKSGEIGRSFAKAFTEKFTRTLRREQGINWINSGDRGAASLRAVASLKQSILVEPFFIDNKDEWIEPEIYSQFIIDWLQKL